MLLQLLINGLILGSVYSLLALGFAIIYNTTKILHFAYAILYMFCPYIFLTLHYSMGINFFLSIIMALGVTMLLSILIETLVYLPLVRNKSSMNIFTISSIGVMTIVINIIAMLYGNETKIINQGTSGSITIGNIIVIHTQLYQLVASLILIASFLVILKFTKFGIITRALRDNNLLCSVFGLDIARFRLLLFAVSGLFAGIAGLLVAYDVGIDPYVGMAMLLNAVVALIIGGVGKFEGPIIGGFVIGVLQAFAVWKFSNQWQNVVTFLLLILFLLVRPQGILGEKQRLV